MLIILFISAFAVKNLQYSSTLLGTNRAGSNRSYDTLHLQKEMHKEMRAMEAKMDLCLRGLQLHLVDKNKKKWVRPLYEMCIWNYH